MLQPIPQLPGPAEQPLTETIIKKVALRFFRHYYKFRLRFEDQPVTAKYDLEGVGGIIADGFYSFKKPDGRPFTATFEATSIESKDEVVFKPEQRVLFWDGLAVTSILLVLLASINLRSGFHQLDNTKYLERLGILLILAGLTYGVFNLIAKIFRRYRYIYAVEQFKKYHADEQWIALGTDVFEDKNDKYLRELKSQCVYNGFGLMTIDPNLDPKIVITPSRHDIFAGKRKHVDFLAQKKMQEIEQKGRFDLAYGLFGNQLPGFLKRDKSVLRYRKSFHAQMAITAGCVVMLALIFIREMDNPEFQTVDKQEFTTNIAKSKSNNLEEPASYLGDSSSMPKPKKGTADGGYWDLNKAQEPASSNQNQETAPLADYDAPARQEESTSRGGESYLIYDCSRFYNFDGKKFIVEVGEFTVWDVARNQVESIRGKGIESAALLKTCFTEDGKGYLVYVGLIFNSADEASSQMESWLDSKAFTKTEMRNWKIRAIEPVVK
ncbi:MAG: hypothetical protein HY842_02200 [Bacteroidetes bacterium]|nr:hypothetical protein [Bacteroidota bacterium]